MIQNKLKKHLQFYMVGINYVYYTMDNLCIYNTQ